jgi:photosystem II stability/assembly factor-like uncharacterized protein
LSFGNLSDQDREGTLKPSFASNCRILPPKQGGALVSAIFDRVSLRSLVLRLVVLFALTAAMQAGQVQWTSLSPEGGDVRSLAYDPSNPERVYLGTSAGKLFVSNDGGATWSRLAHLGSGNDYVLDNIAVDSTDANILYVAAWSVENNEGGDLFRSKDGGKTWFTLNGVHGKSLRALALAPSNPKVIVVGALDGVYLSSDQGETWYRITPTSNSELRNFESVAIDPHDPNTIYAGTWHLPWKTSDGGANWKSIKKGLIDDSDVFSIIIDSANPSIVFLSACSGIYKSEDGGELFHKVQGIPFSARRTRVLEMDPRDHNVVYAGTTEGLWKTLDGGKTFSRMTAANVVVNDVMIHPRDNNRVLLATDRMGLMASNDSGHSFNASNRGFTHRQVTSLVPDRNDSHTLYAGVINDKEFGGVFVSRDSGANWQQMSLGLDGRDVFALAQAANGRLVAGTNRGVFTLGQDGSWRALNTVIQEKVIAAPARSRKKGAKMQTVKKITRSELNARVNDLELGAQAWYAATQTGLYISIDGGSSWKGGPVAGQKEFVAVRAREGVILAASQKGVAVSLDGGKNWFAPSLPPFISAVKDVAIGSDATMWLASREGVFRSNDRGDNWEHVLSGLPAMNIASITYDEEGKRFLAASSVSPLIYESTEGGRRWHMAAESSALIRSVASHSGRLFVTTAFDGVLTQNETEPARVSAGGGGR